MATTGERASGCNPNMNRVRELRLARGLLQKDLALELGVSNGKMSKIENGKQDLNELQIRTLASILKVHPGEILAPLDIGGFLNSLEGDAKALIRQILSKIDSA